MSETLKAGSLEATLDEGGLRWIRWNGVEVLRGLSMTVRDQAWGTLQPRLHDLRIERHRALAAARFGATFQSSGVSFEVTARVVMNAGGWLSFDMKGVAGSTFLKNRIGLIVLYPLQVAGRRAMFERTDGSVAGAFPRGIDPSTVATDLRAIAWAPMRGVSARVEMRGDLWEIEDQRNWTDASFKTYPTPLRFPFPVEIRAGEIVEQGVRLQVSGAPLRQREAPQAVIVSHRASGFLPDIGSLDRPDDGPLSDESIAALRRLQPRHLRPLVDLGSAAWMDRLDLALDRAHELGCQVLLDVIATESQPAELQRLAQRLSRDPSSLDCAFFFSPLSSSGFDSTPGLLEMAGSILPGLRIGGGTRANFAELNRAPALVGKAEVVTFAANPQVHAFDEASMVETLEALPQTVRAAEVLGHGRSVSVVLTLRPRFNAATGARSVSPVAGAIPERVDARQASPFAAAWTVGAVAALTAAGVRYVTLFETTGMAGIVMDPADAPNALFSADPGEAFPVFGVVEALAGVRSPRRLHTESPPDLAVLAFRHSQGVRILLSNLSPQRRDVLVRIPRQERSELRRLSATPWPALSNLGWSSPALFEAPRGHVEIGLSSWETVRIDSPGT